MVISLSVNISDEVDQALQDIVEKEGICLAEAVRRSISAYAALKGIESAGYTVDFNKS